MYDILQLNDMLVPELLDIAEQLNITNAKKADKQDLIYKILDKQALATSDATKNGTEKPKRKRIIKANTANTTEEAEVMNEPAAGWWIWSPDTARSTSTFMLSPCKR